MLRRFLVAQSANPLQALCATRWVGRGVTRVSARAPLTTPKQRIAKTVLASHSRTNGNIDSAVKVMRPEKKKSTRLLEKSKTRNTTKTKTKAKVVKTPATGRSRSRQPAASKKRASIKPSSGKSSGHATKSGMKKGHLHAHTVQKMKYNKRVAAIAKLWRMQKQGSKPAAVVSNK